MLSPWSAHDSPASFPRRCLLAGQRRFCQGTAKLAFRAVPAETGHPRQVNLVVFEKPTGKPLQALSVSC